MLVIELSIHWEFIKFSGVSSHKIQIILSDHSMLTALRRDSDIVNLFLFGHKEISTEKNSLIFEMAQIYINASERFSSISLQ